MTSERKLTQNESVFREVNENIEKAAVEHRYGAGELPAFVCECADQECGELIRMSLTQYEEVRRYPSRFLIVPGHEHPRIERVIERFDDYVVLEKVGVGRETAEEGDPRAGEGPGLPPS